MDYKQKMYTGIDTVTKKEVTGYYKIVFGKHAIFVPGEGLFYIKNDSLKLAE